MDEKIAKLFLPLLEKLYNTEPAGEPFRNPVDVVKYGCYDYYLYVEHPIDLSTIRDRLTQFKYKQDAWRFIADIQLMFSNAYLFNKRGTPVYEFTNKLSKIWNLELTPVMQKLNYCCGTSYKFGPQLLFCHGTTTEKYCQIPIGAKYKCYQDQYSFCLSCFNKIESDFINIQNLSCETTRMKLPTQPVHKDEFIDCTNDNWQYERFIQCSQCTRRCHQICELYPADDDETASCTQFEQIEHEQKMLCQVPEEYRTNVGGQVENALVSQDNSNVKSTNEIEPGPAVAETCPGQNHTNAVESAQEPAIQDQAPKPEQSENEDNELCTQKENCDTDNDLTYKISLDDELLQFARDVEDCTSFGPNSPNPDDAKTRIGCAKENDTCKNDTNQDVNMRENHRSSNTCPMASTSSNIYLNTCNNALTSGNAKNSVDSIAARLSINKMTTEHNIEEFQSKPSDEKTLIRNKFLCNHCYRKKKIGFDLRHRKYSARRLPHTRMSRYIETKVNEYIREHQPSAGEVTIRVLTAYKDTVHVKPEMSEYMSRCRQKDNSFQHPNLNNYPNEFSYLNRAIFAWQEIDGVDVCVFGMHVQEYGEDCPEPNRQVIYLSYLDSVHFFRPKQVRTAVYHEILLSYFKYVKKLGFRRVFIWVCPSRKGDDYIFYRHPTEQKMPTLKRLSDWYVNLLDKGIAAGIVEKHQNIHQYASSQNGISIWSMPYLCGDYWPGEFERLLKLMIESQKVYETKMNQIDKKDSDDVMILEATSDVVESTSVLSGYNSPQDRKLEQNNVLSHGKIDQKAPPNSSSGKNPNSKNPFLNSCSHLRSSNGPSNFCFEQGDNGNLTTPDDFSKFYDNSYMAFTPDSSSKTDSEQPLDLSKSSNNTSPESYYDEDLVFELNCNKPKKRRRKSVSMGGYVRKRSRASSSTQGISRVGGAFNEGFNRFASQSKTSRQKLGSQMRDSTTFDHLLDPEEELIKNLERSLKRQREGFIVARLNDCDCSPHFESQRRKEEVTFTCDLMKGREPFLQLARLKNYEFSTLRRAKFSSLAMVKHLGQFFKLDPICNECFSFDSSKRHYACQHCHDYYLCTSCHENTRHAHIMSLMAPSTPPDIDEFLQQCSLASATNSISSASSTISNKSFNETNLDISMQSTTPIPGGNYNDSPVISTVPLNRHPTNSQAASMPLSCQRQRNQGCDLNTHKRAEDEENSDIFDSGTSKSTCLPNQPVPQPSHTNTTRNFDDIDLDQVLIESFIRHAEVSYAVDYDRMKNESRKILTHYYYCSTKETCPKCKFVVLSCSFMSSLVTSDRMQTLINSSESVPNNNSTVISSNSDIYRGTSHASGVNLTTARRFNYKPNDK